MVVPIPKAACSRFMVRAPRVVAHTFMAVSS